MSNNAKYPVQNSVNMVFGNAPDSTLVREYLDSQDFSINTLKAVIPDLRKFAAWFSSANNEPFKINRVTTRDISDFKDHLRRQQGLAVATVNRCLVSLRGFFKWLADNGRIQTNPTKKIKELRRQTLCAEGDATFAKCGGFFGKLNCVRMFGRERSSRCSFIRDAESGIWLPLNCLI